MAPRPGPTKKLAPMIGPDAGCPHEYSEDEGLQLEIDCSECKGAHDLGNSKCLSAVLNVLAVGAQPEVIVLRRFMHKRYRGEAVRIASAAASDLATLKRAIASTPRPSDRRCRTCPASKERLLIAIKQSLLNDPTRYVTSSRVVAEELRQGIACVGCAKAQACLEDAVRAAETRVEADR